MGECRAGPSGAVPDRQEKQMRMRKVITVFGAVLALAGGVCLAAVEMDVDLMQTIEDTNKELASHIALKESKEAIADAKSLTAMFDKVEAHFVQKGDAANAVDLSKKSKDLTIAIVNSVSANDFDKATDSATTLSRTCRACHTFYKKE
jgi:hypothetical protein